MAVDDKMLHKKVWSQPDLQSSLHDYIVDHSSVDQVSFGDVARRDAQREGL